MPKPKSKEELLVASQENYKLLINLIDSYSKEDLQRQFPKGTLNRNIRDVISHLHQWHLMILDWYKVGMKGSKPDMPAKGYTWQTLPDLNKKIWKDCQSIEIETAKDQLVKSFKKVQSLISKHSNEELFEKKRYHWTGSTSLAAYLILNTSSHYNWAYKLIKKSMK